MVQARKTIILLIVIIGIVAAIALLETSRGSTRIEEKTLGSSIEEKVSMYEPAKEIVRPSGFINSEPFQLADYIGKQVILLDFMTYSCINCQRTFPYLNAWYDKYRNDGLIIVGIHTPEFSFEKDYDNVLAAMEKYGIKFPVVLDNEYATWRAYGNRYWPRKYLIDIDGYIVDDHIGEGGYTETEMKIQALLRERAERLNESVGAEDTLVSVSAKRATGVQTPEIYFGANRNSTYLGNGAVGQTGTQVFTLPSVLQKNVLYLGGTWEIGEESAVAKDRAMVQLQYTATEVYMVLAAQEGGTVTVVQDEVAKGTIDVSTEDLYVIIANDVPGTHTLELEFSPGVEAFTFTFG